MKNEKLRVNNHFSYYIKCGVCGEYFLSNNPQTRRCSDACRREYRTIMYEKKYPKKCDVCGKTFVTSRPYQKRCSNKCSDAGKYLVEGECSKCGALVWGTYAKVNSHTSLCYHCKLKREKISRKNYTQAMPTVMSEIKERSTSPINTWLTPGFSEGLKNAVKERDGWRCYICEGETNLQVHHIMPRSEGGRHEMENLVTLCVGCHRNVESGNLAKAVASCVTRSMNNIV